MKLSRIPASHALAGLAVSLLVCGCGLPGRFARIPVHRGELAPLEGFENVRAVDGYPNAAFQASFDEAIAAFAATPVERGRRAFDMLVLSSGGVNGAFGAGILTAWSERGDRPVVRTVTGVSVGALLAPFAFAGSAFDDRLERLFRFLEPSDLHRRKGLLASVLWEESIADNQALRDTVRREIDEELLRAVAAVARWDASCASPT